MTSSFPIAICLLNGNYPSEYWNLPGVTDIKAPSELWWASKERRPSENGAITSEYLELDMGRVRSFNFLNFSILQKPIDIFIDYDVWGFDSGVKNWQPVTRLQGERFDDRVDYLSTQANPWKDCQFYFTNVKGDMLSTRYLRIRFERRNQIWPNATISGTFPWSIDVRHLRTARYAVTLNDARGLLTNQGKVIAPIVDPIRSVDDAIVTMVFEDLNSLDAATVTTTGEISGSDVHVLASSRGRDGETWFAFYATTDNVGTVFDADGYNNFNAVINGNGQEDNNGVGPAGIRAGDYTDANEASHLATDIPDFRVGWFFAGASPSHLQTYGWMIALGTGDSSGVHTTSVHDYGRHAHGTPNTTVSGSNNFLPPPAGMLMTYFIVVGGGNTISNDALLTAGGWTLATSTASDPDTGFAGYFYTKLATGSEGDSYTYPSVTLSGSAIWSTHFSYLSTPSDPTGSAYVMDSHRMSDDPTPRAFSNGLRFYGTSHGGLAPPVTDYHDSAVAKVIGVPSDLDTEQHVDSNIVSVTGVPSGIDSRVYAPDSATVTTIGIPSDSGDIYTPGGGPAFGDNENYVAFAWHNSSNAFGNAPVWTGGLYTGATSGGGAAVNFTHQGEVYDVPAGNTSSTRFHVFQDATAGHLLTDLPWLEMQYSDGDIDTRIVIIRTGDGTHGPNAVGTTTTRANVTQVPDLGGPGFDGISVDVSAIASTDLCFFLYYQNVSFDYNTVVTPGLTLVADIPDPEITGGFVSIYAGIRGANTTFEAFTDNTNANVDGLVTSIAAPGSWTSTRFGVLFNDIATYTGTGDRGTSLTHPEV